MERSTQLEEAGGNPIERRRWRERKMVIKGDGDGRRVREGGC